MRVTRSGSKIWVIAAHALAALSLPGCAVTPPESPPAARCGLSLLKAEVTQPHEQLRRFLDRGRDAGLAASASSTRPPANSILILSGGSQHGAFGAGYLAEWSRQVGGLPRFRTVTGVSTGAILSSWAFIGEPEVMEKEYAIQREGQVLRPFVRRNAKGQLGLGAYLAIARRGAQADLQPLRTRLLDLLDDRVMGRIAEEAAQRSLLIGLVDVDSGDALVADLGDLARRYVSAPPARKPLLKDCYADAIIASSSVPPSAPPAFIDNRMYIDGGARFGLIGPAFLKLAMEDIDKRTPLDMYLVVNGSQEIKPQCGRRDAKDCPGGVDPSSNVNHPHRDWDLIDLALRSVDILTSQIYRFSVRTVADDFERTTGRGPHYARITREVMLEHRFPGGTGRTCAEWKEDDAREDRPLEFFPRYMNCVADYGRRRAREMKWGSASEVRSDMIE